MFKIISTTAIFFSIYSILFSQLSEIKLLPSVGSINDHFGKSVCIDGEYAIVGASGAEKVFVFKKLGTHWNEVEILEGEGNPNGSTLSPAFGFSVGISGNYAIIGAPFQVVLPILNNIGAAFIFKRIGEVWVLQNKIPPPDGHLFGLFGWSVSISNSFAVIGEPGSNLGHIYRRIGETWSQDTTLSSGYRFGESVSIADNYISIGNVGGGILWEGQGSTDIYYHNGSNWNHQSRLNAIDSSDIDGFGEAVSLSTTHLIAGDRKALNHDSISTGAAYIFNREDTTGAEGQKIIASDGSLGDLFGSSVSTSGSYAIAAAPEDQDKGIKSGSAYIFKKNGDGWVEQLKLLASDGAANDNFGTAVSISGNNIIIGADGNDDQASNSGSAYIYSDFVSDVKNDKSEMPLLFHLSQNYPNPFNPLTTITFSVPEKSNVVLNVFNSLGEEVALLVNEEKRAGTYGVEFTARNFSSGIYFYILQSGDFRTTKKMVYIK